MLGDRSYPIVIRNDSLIDLGETLLSESNAERVVVITSPRVEKLHWEAVEQGLEKASLA